MAVAGLWRGSAGCTATSIFSLLTVVMCAITAYLQSSLHYELYATLWTDHTLGSD